MKIKTHLTLFYILISVVILINLSVAQSQESDLTSPAQETIERGLEAAKQKQWEQAIEYFSQAREIVPTSPHVLLNLASANDRMERELIAIAWYEAYLVAAPDAVNSEQVRSRITTLKATAQKKIQKLINIAMESVDKEIEYGDRREYYKTFAKSLAVAGDIQGAQQILSEKIGKDYNYYKENLYCIAQAQAFYGDIEGARQTLALMDKEPMQSEALAEALAIRGDIEEAVKFAANNDEALIFISKLQIKQGDIEGAKKTAGKIKTDYKKEAAYTFIAEAQFNAGDINGGMSTLGSGNDRIALRKMVQLGQISNALFKASWVSGNYNKVVAFAEIAIAQAEAGDTEGALKTVKKGIEIAKNAKWERNPFFEPEPNAYKALIKAQAKAGDLKGLRETARLVDKDLYESWSIDYNIAEAEAKAGKISQALAIAARAKLPETKVFAYSAIADVLFEKGDIKKTKQALEQARKVAIRMEKENDRDYHSCEVAKKQAKMGDITGAFKTVENITKDDKRSEALYSIVEAQAKAGDFTAAIRTHSIMPADGDWHHYKDWALSPLAECKAKAGDYAEAIKLARRIEDGYTRNLTLLRLLEVSVQNKDAVWIRRILDEGMMTKPEIKGLDDWYFIESSQRLAKAGNIKLAKDTASLISNDNIKSWALLEITEIQARLNVEDPKHKRIAIWTELCLDYSTKPILLDFQLVTDSFKYTSLKTNIFYLGKIAGSMAYHLNELRKTQAGLEEAKKRF